MANLFQPSLVRATDTEGSPVSNAKMYFYAEGTLTPATWYTDLDGTVPGTNPLTANSVGIFAPAYLDPETIYRVKLTDSDGSETLWDVDHVRGFDETQLGDAAADAIAAAEQVADDAASVATNRVLAGNSASTAAAAALATTDAQTAAETARDDAETAAAAAALAADRIYPDTTTALTALAEGDYFYVQAGDDLQLYREVAGAAVAQSFLMPGAATIDAALADPTRYVGPFLPEATDSVARAAITDIKITDADETDSYFINYEFSYFSGIPLYRVKVRLHSVNRGAEVARWELQQGTDPALDYEPTLNLSARSDAFEVIADTGVTAIVTMDWANVTYTGGGAVTGYTNTAATGIRRDRVVTAAETKRNRLAPATPISRLITVGSSGDFPTLMGGGGAWEFIEQGSFATPITRSTYPSSHICGTEYPLEVRVTQTAYSEQITPFTQSAIDQSPLRIPHGLILHLPYRDTLIYMDTPGNSGPVIEMNFSGTIYGQGKIEQRGTGYVVHIDSNGTIVEDYVRDLQSVVRGVTLRKTYDDTVPLIGLGIASGQDVLFDGVRFERPTNTLNGPQIAGHNSPGEVRGGLLHIRNCTSLMPGTGKFLSMGKTNASTVRHGIIIENSEVEKVEVYNTAGGANGYVRMSPMTGITITGDMEP